MSAAAPSPRPAGSYYFDGPSVLLLGRTAAWLLTETNLSSRRTQVRGADCEVDAQLNAIAVLGQHWRSSASSAEAGTTLGKMRNPAPVSEDMSSKQAGTTLGIDERSVRKACAEGRLPAVRTTSGWRIRRPDVDDYYRRRTA